MLDQADWLSIWNTVTLGCFVSTIVFAGYHLIFNWNSKPGDKYDPRNKVAPQKNVLHIRTPLIQSEWLTDLVRSQDGADLSAQVHLKMEAGIQRSGSFKIRGIGKFCVDALENLDPQIEPSNVAFVSSSHANAGLATAHAARELGAQCIIVLPIDELNEYKEYQKQSDDSRPNPSVLCKQLSKIESLGCVEFEGRGDTWNECDQFARDLCDSSKSSDKFNNQSEMRMIYVPMFDHPSIFRGHASISREILDEMNDCDCMIVSVGGGGLLSGVCLGIIQCALQSQVKIIATNSESCRTLAAVMDKGEPYKPALVEITDANGLSLGRRQVCDKACEWLTRFKQRFGNEIEVVTVSDEATKDAVNEFAKQQNVLLEALCAQSVAVLLSKPELFVQYRRICVVVCGGSMIPTGVNYL